jgi:prepilin-type N-terminal cleavage/methylation domain-containing protein
MKLFTLNNKKRTKKTGLTLLELLIVCAIAAIGMAGALKVIISARRTLYEAKSLTKISIRANTELEKWRSRSYESLEQGIFPITDIEDEKTSGTVQFKKLRNMDLMEITVTIHRSDSKGTRKVAFNTIRGRKKDDD